MSTATDAATTAIIFLLCSWIKLNPLMFWRNSAVLALNQTMVASSVVANDDPERHGMKNDENVVPMLGEDHHPPTARMTPSVIIAKVSVTSNPPLMDRKRMSGFE